MREHMQKQSHKRIHLIRHGMTEGNQKGWYYGKTDLPLCEEGRSEIKELAHEIDYPCTTENSRTEENSRTAESLSAVESIYSIESSCADGQAGGEAEAIAGDTALFFTTGVSRTEETFELIYGAREHGVFEAFLEMDFGDFECHSYEELKDVPAYQEWIKDGECIKNTYHGESRPDFEDRVWQGWQDLIRMLESDTNSTRTDGAEPDTNSTRIDALEPDNERTRIDALEPDNERTRIDALEPDTESTRTGPSDIVIVCHGGPISAVMERCFPGQRKWIFEWIPKPGRGFSVEIKGSKATSFIEI